MLSLKNLSVSIGEKKIINDFNFFFKKNHVYALMGPNGSGKSTLAYTIAGHPAYKVASQSKIIFNKKNIVSLSADKRAKKGIFLSFQTPLSLNGVNVFQLLRVSLSGVREPLEIKEEIEKIAKKLHIKKELLVRSLNEGASGGEKKKLELLQAAIINADFLIFDEIDTGVDIDALKTIANYLASLRKNKTILVITHYNRILRYLKPDQILVLIKGRLAKTGNYLLAEQIERNGYEKIGF